MMKTYSLAAFMPAVEGGYDIVIPAPASWPPPLRRTPEKGCDPRDTHFVTRLTAVLVRHIKKIKNLKNS